MPKNCCLIQEVVEADVEGDSANNTDRIRTVASLDKFYRKM